MGVARTLAEFILGMDFNCLPPRAAEHSKMAIADTIGDAMCGAHLRSAEIIREVVRARKGVPEATVWGSMGFKTDCGDTARVNSVMSETLPLCESHVQAIAHSTYAIVPTAVSVGEHLRVSGRQLITAVALGYEIAGRIGISIAPSYILERGFHTAVVTILGSATAAGKLLNLSEDQMTHAIALAATSAGGLAASGKTAAREYHAGTATLLGINAALAAQAGYEGEETIIEKPHGYCETFSTSYNLVGITADLGKEWDLVTDMAFKFIPTSHGIHTPVEATIALVKSDNIYPSDVRRVTVLGPSWLKGYLIYHPQSSPGASHSMPYCIASSIVDREFSWHHMNKDKITRQEIQDLQDLVEIVDSGLYEFPGGTTVTITTADGVEHTHTVDLPIGMPQRGYDWSQVEEKYLAIFPKGGLPDHKGKASLELLKGLEQIGDITELITHLVP